MTLKEKYLYHQIHPFKLSVDIGTTLVGFVPLWRHQLIPAILIMVPPAMLATVLTVAFANLEPQKESRLGRYMARDMTRAAEAQRLLGICVVGAGVWNHSLNEFALGVGVILVAWMQGVYPLNDTVQAAPG